MLLYSTNCNKTNNRHCSFWSNARTLRSYKKPRQLKKWSRRVFRCENKNESCFLCRHNGAALVLFVTRCKKDNGVGKYTQFTEVRPPSVCVCVCVTKYHTHVGVSPTSRYDLKGHSYLKLSKKKCTGLNGVWKLFRRGPL